MGQVNVCACRQCSRAVADPVWREGEAMKKSTLRWPRWAVIPMMRMAQTSNVIPQLNTGGRTIGGKKPKKGK